jgi:hypothetical protein
VSYHFTARIEVQNGVDVTSRFQIARPVQEWTARRVRKDSEKSCVTELTVWDKQHYLTRIAELDMTVTNCIWFRVTKRMMGNSIRETATHLPMAFETSTCRCTRTTAEQHRRDRDDRRWRQAVEN